MIGKLRGKIDSIQEDRCILDVNGVGYVVYLSNKTVGALRKLEPNSEISLIIETLVKEDAIDLYGFLTEIEKIWFLELTKVQGVGAKVAHKILSFFNIDEIAKALMTSDVKSFSQVSGIGPKLAQRITTELKDSPKKLGIDVSFISDVKHSSNVNIENEIIADAVSALENLGYKKSDTLKFITNLCQKNPDITLENLITSSLREINKNKF